jgi:hypothetical protein
MGERKGGRRGKEEIFYQVGERIQFLSHHAALFPPARHLAVESVKKQPERQEEQRRPEVAVL